MSDGREAATMMEAINEAIVHISGPLMGQEKPMGLGILCGERIFTCAHYRDSLPTGIAELHIYPVTRVCDGFKADFAMNFTTNLDLMVLAPNTLHFACGEDEGPTSSAYELMYLYEESRSPLRPASIVFFSGVRSASVKGVFFAPDGKTLCPAEFQIHEDSPTITFYSKEMVKGCSGGPLITDDHKIIGVATSFSNILDGEARSECLGKRIDLCVPVYLQRQIDWDTLEL